MSTLVSLLFLLSRREVTFYSPDRNEKSIACFYGKTCATSKNLSRVFFFFLINRHRYNNNVIVEGII